jgi:broad specificity phosphatase PhoE
LDCDIELTKLGFKDACNAAKRIEVLNHGPFYGNMYYSPYTRAKQTALKIKEKFEKGRSYITNFREHALIHEREWGGLRDIVSQGMKSENHFNFFYRPLNGESFNDCLTRVVTFDNWLMSVIDRDSIIVSHGEFIKLYLMHKLKWTVEDFNIWKCPRNGEVFLLRGSPDQDNWVLSPLTNLTPRNK